MIPKFERYHWFKTIRKDSSEGWVEHAANLKQYHDWCVKNIGHRAACKWVIIDSHGKALPPGRSYNVQTFHALGIEDSELAMLFRLKFNI
jgi:hypothetical protein